MLASLEQFEPFCNLNCVRTEMSSEMFRYAFHRKFEFSEGCLAQQREKQGLLAVITLPSLMLFATQ